MIKKFLVLKELRACKMPEGNQETVLGDDKDVDYESQ